MIEAPAEKPNFVRSLLDPSPSLEFQMQRRTQKGTVEYPFRSRILRADQNNDANVSAREYYLKKTKAKDVDEASSLYREALAQEILVRSTVQSELVEMADGTKAWRPYFVNADQLRASLDVTEQAQLLRAHYLTEAYYGFSSFDEEKLEGFIDVLKNDLTGTYFLSQLDSADVPRLIFALARLVDSWRPEDLRTPSNSGNSSESDPSSSESGTIGSLPPLSERSIGLVIPESDEAPTRAEAHRVVLDHQANIVSED